MKLKLFQGYDIDDLEIKVNDWIAKMKSQPVGFVLRDCLMTQSESDESEQMITIAIWYD